MIQILILYQLTIAIYCLHAQSTFGPFFYPTGNTSDPIYITFGEYNATHFYLNAGILGEHWFGFGFAKSGVVEGEMNDTHAIIFGYHSPWFPLNAKEYILDYHKKGYHQNSSYMSSNQIAQYILSKKKYQYNFFVRRPFDPSSYGYANRYTITKPLSGEFCWIWAQGIGRDFTGTTSHINKGYQCIDSVGTNIPTSAKDATHIPTKHPTLKPTESPTHEPTSDPILRPTPVNFQTRYPTDRPTYEPTTNTYASTEQPTKLATPTPTFWPTGFEVMVDETTVDPTDIPSIAPTIQCTAGCLLYYIGNCNSCSCDEDRGSYICSQNECVVSHDFEAYCKQCNTDKKACDGGYFVGRLLEHNCEFEACVYDQISGNDIDLICWIVWNLAMLMIIYKMFY
eukprot:549531_1